VTSSATPMAITGEEFRQAVHPKIWRQRTARKPHRTRNATARIKASTAFKIICMPGGSISGCFLDPGAYGCGYPGFSVVRRGGPPRRAIRHWDRDEVKLPRHRHHDEFARSNDRHSSARRHHRQRRRRGQYRRMVQLIRWRITPKHLVSLTVSSCSDPGGALPVWHLWECIPCAWQGRIPCPAGSRADTSRHSAARRDYARRAAS
jgi:hypothetical protein